MSVIRVGRRSRRTFSTDFEIFRRRFGGVVIYFFFNPDFEFFDDASEFSVTSLYVVFMFSFSSKFMLIFLQSVFYEDYRAIVRSSTVLIPTKE